MNLQKGTDAFVFVDDAHGIGVCGKTGRGTAEQFSLLGEIDVTVGTLGKAIGGAAGGFISGSKELIGYLRQKGRPLYFRTLFRLLWFAARSQPSIY